MFAVDAVPDGVSGGPAAGLTSTLVSGDVLFAGSIGRTDLPGGDHAAMMRSLREKVLTQPDGALVPARARPRHHDRPGTGHQPYLSEARG